MITFTKRQKKLIGKNIRSAMEKTFPGKGRGRRLAYILGVSPSMVSQWANGKKTPTVWHLYRMAKVFSIPLHQLCGLSKRKNIRTKNLAAATIKRLTSSNDKKGTPLTKKASRSDLRVTINLINKELDELKKQFTDDA